MDPLALTDKPMKRKIARQKTTLRILTLTIDNWQLPGSGLPNLGNGKIGTDN